MHLFLGRSDVLMRAAMPLEGLTLIELVGPDTPAALALSIGMCGRVANDLGARVKRLIATTCEPVDTASDIFLNSGKTCLSVAPDRFDALAADLLATTDCVIMDATSQTRLSPVEGRAVVVSLAMTANALSEGSEFTIEAQSGLLDLVGDPDKSPLRLGGHQTAYAAGLSAYLAMASALPKHAAGQSVPILHVNLLDVAVWLNWKTLAVSARTGEAPTRKGTEAEWSALKCEDGYFAAVYRTKDWDTLKSVLNDPRLDDPKIQTSAGRRAHRTEVNALLSALFQCRSRAEIYELSLANKLPLGPVWTPQELGHSAHLIERQFLTTLDVGTKKVVMPTLPVKWSERTFPPTNITS